ncbi:hypothetical protein P3S68_024516 [Capsicum galapagoense]
MSQSNNVSENQNQEASQNSINHDFGQSSIQQTNEHHQIQYTYGHVHPNQFVLNHYGMYSASRPMSSPVPKPSFAMGQNLPPEGYNINSNSVVIPSIVQNARARASRTEVIERGHIEANHQHPNAPLSTMEGEQQRTLYDPIYAENGLPVDPFLRQMMLNPSFGNTKGNK